MAHQLGASARAEITAAREALARLVEDSFTLEQVEFAAKQCAEAIRSGNKVMFAGNGGSAADAQHLAGEFVSRFNFDRPGMAGLALTTDTSVLTAIGNDYGYEHLFSRQVEALGRKGDVLFGITTSGRSPNVLNAFRRARDLGVTSIGLTGQRGASLKDYCDICIAAPAAPTPRVQELHIVIGHTICSIVESLMFGDFASAKSRS